MAKINSRDGLKNYALKALGSPVINIEVDETQLQDRIDEALEVFTEKHYDAVEETWTTYVLTQEDIDNQYITVPDNILTVNKMIDVNQLFSGRGDMFSYKYQIAINELSPWTHFDQVSYFLKVTNFESVMNMITAQPTIQYTRHMNKLKVYDDLNKFGVGAAMAFQVSEIINPDVNKSIWNDKWLKEYTIALFKRQWGTNVYKYQGIQLLGGMTIDGDKLYNGAMEDVQRLKEELNEVYSEPVGFIFG